MGTVKQVWTRPADSFDGIGTVFPQISRVAGTNFPVYGLAFDAGADEACSTLFVANNYGSGNLTLILKWYADTATSGNVVWGGAVAAITPATDNQNIETKAFATENTVTAAAGGSAQEPETSTITISNLDSIAADDVCHLRIRRVGSNGSDTMTGDAILVAVELQYSD